MRIGYVGPILPEPGGIAQHGHHLVEALTGTGHELVAIGWRSAYPGSHRRGRASSVGLPVARILQWWNPLSWLRAGNSVAGADGLIVQYVHPFHAFALTTVMKRGGIRTVVVAHNSVPHEWFPLARPLARMVFRHAEVVVSHSEFVGAEIADIYPGVHLVSIPMPPLIRVEKVVAPIAGEFRLLFLGYVRNYKGLSQLLEALRLVRDRGLDVSLTVAGEFWKDEDAYRKQIGQLGLEQVVEVRSGYLPDEEVGPLLADHHLLVAPYQEASQSGVVPLALAAGRPALVTDVGGLSEQVEHGMDGLVVRPDPESLAVGIEAAMGEYGRLAAGAARSSVNWSDMVAVVVASLQADE